MNDVYLKAKKYIDFLREKGISVSEAYLFGSYAKGNAKDWSDIDICVVSRNFGKDYFDEMVSLRKLAGFVDDRIEPHPFAEGDLDDPYSILSTEIRKYGVKIDVA